jgi:hypothetical protein
MAPGARLRRPQQSHPVQRVVRPPACRLTAL